MKNKYSDSMHAGLGSAEEVRRPTVPSCVMIGPCDKSKGGMASVVASYRTAGMFADGEVMFIPTVKTGNKGKKLGTAMLALYRYLAVLSKGGGQVLHVHAASGTSFVRKAIFILLALVCNRKVLLHIHGGGFVDFYENRCVLPAKIIVRGILRNVDHIACLSSKTAAWASKFNNGKPHFVSVFPNPVEVISEAGEGRRARDANILFLGMLAREKGVIDLLRAFSLVLQHVPRAQLTLAGSGNQDYLASLASDLGCGEAVQIHEWAGPEVKEAMIRNARVLALPSYFEGQPMVILEAMALRTLVVASNVGGIPDLVQHHQTGLLVEPGNIHELADALVAALSPTAENERIIESAYRYVSGMHDAARVTRRLRHEYSRLISK